MKLPVICATDDALIIEPNAPYEFFMAFENSQTCTTFNVPQTATMKSQLIT